MLASHIARSLRRLLARQHPPAQPRGVRRRRHGAPAGRLHGRHAQHAAVVANDAQRSVDQPYDTPILICHVTIRGIGCLEARGDDLERDGLRCCVSADAEEGARAGPALECADGVAERGSGASPRQKTLLGRDLGRGAGARGVLRQRTGGGGAVQRLRSVNLS
jgi:hypothetical protein